MCEYDIKRGDIFYVYRHPDNIGSEQSSGRPAIVVSNDQCNKHSDVIEIVYLTTQPKTDLPTHVRILATNKESTALCEQITSVDKQRLGDFVGTCNTQEMEAIDTALLISIGLDVKPISIGRGMKQKIPKELEKQLEKTVLIPCPDTTDLVKVETQRDTYKQMYDELLQKLIAKH